MSTNSEKTEFSRRGGEGSGRRRKAGEAEEEVNIIIHTINIQTIVIVLIFVVFISTSRPVRPMWIQLTCRVFQTDPLI